jgi:uridine kinase
MSRGRQLNLSIAQWQRYVKPNYEKYIVHTMDNADVLVPRGLDNVIAINMLANHVMKQLLGKSQQHMSHLAKLDAAAFDKELPPEVVVLEQKSQVIGIHTLLKDHMTSRDDFIFYFNRIAGMLINRALDLFDIYCPKEIETPAGHKFSGVNLSFDNICAVNIIRGGECFNVALKRAIPTIRLGKILIQSDSRTGEPRLHTLRLPPRLSPKPAGPDGRVPSAALEELADTRVVLLDLQISSGAAATMATAVLLDHGVREEDIVLVVYAATRNGLRRVTQAFPRVHIVAGRVDERPLKRFMDSKYYGT